MTYDVFKLCACIGTPALVATEIVTRVIFLENGLLSTKIKTIPIIHS